jgi:23S rRNA A2030 N6-methylase RlmJ
MGHAVLIKMNQYMKRKIKGKKLIGFGGTRVVYDLGGGYVMKVAKSTKGILCNKMEVNIYESCLKPIKKYLAQIIDYDKAYRWVTMKKYDQKFPPNSPIYRRELMKLAKKFLVNGIIPSKGVGHYAKPYAPNLRLKWSKQIVVIDYGGFKYTPLSAF